DLDLSGQAPLMRRFFAEFWGTLMFVAIGTGAATVVLLGPLRRLAGLAGLPGIEDPAQQKLFGSLIGTGASTITEVLPVALAFAFALALLVYAVGGVSGAHFNPAVTFSLAVVRRFPWREVPIYWIAQILGGIAGAFIIVGIYGNEITSSGAQSIMFGATKVAPGVEVWQAILAETFITFILVTAIMAVAVDHRAPKGWSGLIIGLSLAAGILVTAHATGGSANFARTFGPFVASWAKGGVNILPWSDLAVYAVGPLIGASAAALLYESITGLEPATPAPRPGAATGANSDIEEPERGGTIV
ncbi:MAG: glycerol uptake facilitator protein, partial [Actinomycetota bacterium]|nr:glycerol uptake facilitator protein [Actinomycetota bacterium]